jgi:hypothetical protein
METRRNLLASLGSEYQNANRQRKTAILNTLLESTQYSRKHAIKLLSGSPPVSSVNNKKRKRKAKLGQEAFEALIFCWKISSRVCSKRLTPTLRNLVDNLTKTGHLSLSEEARAQLLSVSAATVDRVLKEEREREPRSLSHTKNSALVQVKVPIRTFGEWDGVKPGNFEIDTVSHSSSDPKGPFLSTLNMTDVATCWTLPIAISGKAGIDIVGALNKAVVLMPFPILGLDFDNGAEFLNDKVLDWCDKKQISYWRSRPYKKNDQAWIEEKNRSVVRRTVGRDRFAGKASYSTLTDLYRVLAVYYNFFVPVQKLLTKKRVGAKVYKVHDVARTPYQRVLDNEFVSEAVKNKLRAKMDQLSIYALKTELNRLQKVLGQQAIILPDPVCAAISAQRSATQKFLTHNTKNLVREKPLGMTAAKAIKTLLKAAQPGTMVRATDFLHLGTRHNVDTIIGRLVEKGEVQRIGRGDYQIPVITPTPEMDRLGAILNEAMV